MLWLILSVLLWGFVHSLLASLKAKELAQRWFGVRSGRFYRLIYNIFAALSFIPILGLAVFTPDKKLYSVRLPWSGVMVFAEFLAIVGLVYGFLQTDPWEFLGLRQLGESKGSTGLVTRGVYQYARHPLYTAGLAFIWLFPSMTTRVLAINIGLTIYVVVGAYFEERKLRRAFGREYADYAASTPMFIPFLKGNKPSR